jgi:hypothetical protein
LAVAGTISQSTTSAECHGTVALSALPIKKLH